MPHIRSPSVSSFQSLFRKGSILKNGNGQNQVDRNGMVSSIVIPGSQHQHAHMLPPIPATITPDNSIIEWMERVNETRPEVIIASNPKFFQVNQDVLNDVEPGLVRLNPTASLLFLRVLNTKIYNATVKNSYQLNIRVGNVLSAASCASKKSSGDLIDWFLIDLNQGVNVDNCWIDVFVQPGQEVKHMSLKKLLGVGGNGGSSGSKSQFGSAYDLGGSNSPGPQKPANLRIPLMSVAFSSEDRFPKPWGTYYLTDNERIIGEITLDIAESPECFSCSTNLSSKSKNDCKFAGPLTVLRNEGRVAHWQRVTATLMNRELLAFDFQRLSGNGQGKASLALSNPLWAKSLKQVTSIEFIQRHPMSIENVLEITFVSGEKLFAYADDEKSGMKWADKLSLSIWGQPYSNAAEAY